MTTATWPTTIPQCPIVNGFSEQRKRSIAAYQGETGTPKVNLRSRGVPIVTSITMRMTTTQMGVFYDFYENTLKDGSLPFIQSVYGVPATCHFAGNDAPKVDRITPNTHRLTFTLFRMRP